MTHGWKKITFAGLGRIFNGNSINESEKKTHFEGLDEGVPYIGTKDVSFNHEIKYESGVMIPDGKQDGFKLAPANAVLVCAEGGSAGRKIAYTDRSVYFGNKLFAICPTPPTSSRLIFYYCLSDAFTKQFKGAMAGLIGGVSLNKFKDINIDLPPSPEQQRIVGILDEAFTGIATAKANAEKNLQNARAIFESYLQSVFTQRGPGWVQKCLKEVCEKITDGTHQTPTYYDEGVVFLSSRNVTSGKINWGKVKYIDAKQHLEMHKRVAPRLNDILLAKNGTTGVAAIVDRDITFDIYVSLALLRALDVILPSILLYFINSPVAKKQFNKRLKGSGVPNLHLEEIREVVISFPKTLAEQNAVASKLDGLNKETQRLESIYQKKHAALDSLKKSLLHQAFNGEL